MLPAWAHGCVRFYGHTQWYTRYLRPHPTVPCPWLPAHLAHTAMGLCTAATTGQVWPASAKTGTSLAGEGSQGTQRVSSFPSSSELLSLEALTLATP